MSTVPTIDSQLVNQARHEIRGLVHEIEQLSRREDLAVAEFYREFLGRVVTAMGAVGGVIWLRGESGLRAEHQVGLSEGDLGTEGDDRRKHAKLLQGVMDDGRPLLSQPFSVAGDDDSAGNPTGHLLLVAPLKADRETAGVLEIFQRPAAGAVTQRGYMRFASQMADLAGDFLKNHRLRQFGDRQSLWQQWNQYAKAVHASLDPRRTAFALANEGRRLLACDRVSVLLPAHGSLKLASVSGQEILDVRAGLVKRMQRLAAAVAKTGEDLWFDGQTQDLSPQIETELQAYVDESHDKTLAVLPLLAASTRAKARPELLGVVVIEHFERRIPREELADKVAVIREHGAAAIANAREHDGLWLLPVWKAVSQSRVLLELRNLPKTMLAVGAVMSAALALVLIPADFTLEARGVLQPVERREVFASSDGLVMQVHARHGQSVEQGEVLVELKDADQESKITSLRGEYSSKLARYNAVRNLQLTEKKLDQVDKNRLKGESMELEQSLNSIQGQLRLAEEKQKQLRIVSPIDGEVVTWDVY
ncbi:MAG: GAF domain-containing protein, partial [Pirellulales bacterium]